MDWASLHDDRAEITQRTLRDLSRGHTLHKSKKDTADLLRSMLPDDPRKSTEEYMVKSHRDIWDTMFTMAVGYMRLHPYWEDNMIAQRELYDSIVPKTLAGRFMYRKFQKTPTPIMMVVSIGNFSYGSHDDVILADGESLSWESAWKHGRRLYQYVQDTQVCKMVRFPQDAPDIAEVNTTRILDARRTAIPLYICPDNMPQCDQAGFMLGRRMRVPTIVPARQCNIPITTISATEVLTTYCPERTMTFSMIHTLYVRTRRNALQIRVQLPVPKQTVSLYMIMLILEVQSVDDIMAMVLRERDISKLSLKLVDVYQDLRKMLCEQMLRAHSLKIHTRADALRYIKIDMTDMEEELTSAARTLHMAMGEEDVADEDLNVAAAEALGAKKEAVRLKATNMERMFNMRLNRMFCALLPNVSTQDNTEVNHRKAALIGHMVSKLLRVWYGLVPPDNRDVIVRAEDWSLNIGRMLHQAGQADVSAARYAISKGHVTDTIHPHPTSTARAVIVNAINTGTANRSRAVFNTARSLSMPLVDTQVTKSTPPEGATAAARMPHDADVGIVCQFGTPDGTPCNLVQHVTGTSRRRVVQHYPRGTTKFTMLATSAGMVTGKVYTDEEVEDGALFEPFDDVRQYVRKGRRWRTQPFERVIAHAFGGDDDDADGTLSGMTGVRETIMRARDDKVESWATQQEDATKAETMLSALGEDCVETEEVLSARKVVMRMERIRRALGDDCEGGSVPKCLTSSDMPLLLVDGTPVAVLHDHTTPREVVDNIRLARRSGFMDPMTGTSMHDLGVEIRTQFGAFMSPAIRLEKMAEVMRIAARSSSSVALVAELEDLGIIEYLDREERTECVIAESITQVLEWLQKVRKRRWKGGEGDFTGAEDLWASCHFTHIMLHPAASLHSHALRNMPWANCDEGPRALFFSQMIPQVSHVNHALLNTGVFWRAVRVPCYGFKPMVTTIAENEVVVVRSDNRRYPANNMGVPATVAVMNYKGRKDDCCVVRKGFLQRGGLMEHEYIQRTFTKTPSVTMAPQIVNKRKDLNGVHQLGPDGIIKVGSAVRDRTILVGAAWFPRDGAPPKDHTMVFNATALMKREQWKVHQVDVVNGMRTGSLTVHIVLRRLIMPVRGSKLCLDCGQKFTIAEIVDDDRMPWPEDQYASPIDVIVAPEAFIGRNTLSGIVEMAVGNVAAMKGERYDATMYHPQMAPCPDDFSEPCVTFDKALGDALVSFGFRRDGSFVLRDGETGLFIGATRAKPQRIVPIMCGSVRLLLLEKHDPRNKGFARGVHGSTSMVTNNPTAGRKQHGAVRHGEMDADATQVYGAAKTCSSYIMQGGSACVVPICTSCGQVASKRSDILLGRLPPQMRGRVKALADFHTTACGGGEIVLVELPQVTVVMMDIMRMANVRFNIFTKARV